MFWGVYHAETLMFCWQDPGPQRQLTASLGMVLPTKLDAPGSKGTGHAAAFHHSLLLSVRFYLSHSTYRARILTLLASLERDL